MTTPKLLRVSEVAERLELAASKVYELVERRKLSHHRLEGAIRISEDQIMEYLEETKRERETSEPVKTKPPRPRLRHITLP